MNTAAKSVEVAEIFPMAGVFLNFRSRFTVFWESIGEMHGVKECIGPELDVKIGTTQKGSHQVG